MVRPLNIPNQQPAESEERKVPRTRVLNIPESSIPVPPPAVPVHKTRALNIQDQKFVPNAPAPKQRSQTDDLIDAVIAIDSTIDQIRIRGRIDSLLKMAMQDFLNWGERNLAPLRAASNIQSSIASRMAQINASGWLKETLEASTKLPSGGLFSKKPKPPEYYEAMLLKTRAELMALVIEITTVGKNYEPDVTDLQLDALSLFVVSNQIDDVSNQIIANNRAKSLLASHQTGNMLLQTIEQTKIQAAQFIQQIDDLLSVTLPQWKMAYGK